MSGARISPRTEPAPSGTATEGGPIRILSVGNMYPPHSLGGYEVLWQSWVRYARTQGHDVRVVSTDFQSDAPKAESDVDAEPVFRELRWYWRDHRFPRFAPWTRLAIEAHNASVLEAHLNEFRPDVVTWWGMGGMSTGLIEQVRRCGTPAVGVLGDYWLEYAPAADAWMRMFLRRPRVGRLVERLTGAITTVDMDASLTAVFISDRVRRGAAKVSPAFTAAEVVHPGPDTELFRPVPASPWAWRLLCPGRIDPEKGTDLAIRALLELPDEATLSIDGRGNEQYLGELKRLVPKLGLEQRVRFVQSPRAEVAAAYAAADVVLFPVRWAEPWGLVPSEAMAVGRPVVASGRGGSGEYLRDEENCLIFNPDHGPPELAARVHTLADDHLLRERLVEGGRKTVAGLSETNFDERVQAAIERAVARADQPLAPA